MTEYLKKPLTRMKRSFGPIPLDGEMPEQAQLRGVPVVLSKPPCLYLSSHTSMTQELTDILLTAFLDAIWSGILKSVYKWDCQSALAAKNNRYRWSFLKQTGSHPIWLPLNWAAFPFRLDGSFITLALYYPLQRRPVQFFWQ